MRVKYVKPIVLLTYFWSLLAIIAYAIMSRDLSAYNNVDESFVIWLLSFYGIIQFVFSLYSWKKKTNHLLCGYVIFITFAYMFSFGQCFMWAFGVHITKEIGKVNLYYFSKPTTQEIIRTQMYTLMGLMLFHLGAMTKKNADPRKNQASLDSYSSTLVEMDRKTLNLVCKIACIVSTPVQFYMTGVAYIVNRTYGYGALLYNTSLAGTQSSILSIIQMMYIPSICGLLLSSNYELKTKNVCYINFFAYALLSVAAGNRGEWLIPLIILIWMSHQFNKKINLRKFIIYGIGGFIILFITTAMTSIRDYGVTIDALLSALHFDNNPISSAAFEMGSSMTPTLLMMREGPHVYPYGNSYLLGVLGMISEWPIRLFIPNYIGIGGWYSRDFLHITYGAGFSFIAEAYANFGEYLGLIALFIIGIIISRLLNNVMEADVIDNYSFTFFQIASCYALIEGIRNTTLHALKTWFYSALLLYVITRLLLNRRIHS